MARRMELLVGGLIGGAALVLFGKLRWRRWQSAAASKLLVVVAGFTGRPRAAGRSLDSGGVSGQVGLGEI